MFITTENPCSLSHVKGKIGSCGTAWEASVEYEDAILSQKFIGEHPLCFVFAACMVLCNCYLIFQFLIKFMGAIWWGTRGTYPPTFSGGGDIICDVPPTFSLQVLYLEKFQKQSDVCHVLCEVLIMLDVTHSQVDDETEFGVVLLDSVSLSVIASIK